MRDDGSLVVELQDGLVPDVDHEGVDTRHVVGHARVSGLKREDGGEENREEGNKTREQEGERNETRRKTVNKTIFCTWWVQLRCRPAEFRIWKGSKYVVCPELGIGVIACLGAKFDAQKLCTLLCCD